MKVKLNRDVTTKECPWIPNDFKEGDEVFIFNGHTYGCISSTGTACSLEDDKTPFFELPTHALGDNDDDSAYEGEGNFTTDQPFIEVEKLDSLTGEPHPNGIEAGYTKQGAMIAKPEIGKGFLVSRVGGYFCSSDVTEILEESDDGGKFRTMNSIYKWTKIPTHAEKEAETAE